jgi:hypothetical protein
MPQFGMSLMLCLQYYNARKPAPCFSRSFMRRMNSSLIHFLILLEVSRSHVMSSDAYLEARSHRVCDWFGLGHQVVNREIGWCSIFSVFPRDVAYPNKAPYEQGGNLGFFVFIKLSSSIPIFNGTALDGWISDSAYSTRTRLLPPRLFQPSDRKQYRQ